MNIIIVGAGEVGRHLAENLSSEAHNICVIESNERVAQDLNEHLDIRVIAGTGSSVTTLEEAIVAECDLLLALTSDDNTNLVAASLGKALGAKKTISRVHAGIQREEWLFDYKEHFNINHLFSSERLAAVELAKFIRNPDAIMVEEIARGRIELQQVKVTENSKAAGKTLMEISLPPRVRIGLVQRGKHTFVPSAEDQLAVEDIVTLFGEPRKLQEVVIQLQARATNARDGDTNVVIFGGSESGVALAQMLESGPYRVRIFESDKARCIELSHLLQSTVILNADATSLGHLREEQVGEADFFVATTNQDEDNVMTCLQATHLGTEHCLALIHRADYADAMQRSGKELGILGAVSPREAARRDLLRFVTGNRYRVAAQLNGGSEVIESAVRANSALADHKVAEIDWPKGSGLVALLHKQNATVPAADDIMTIGDTIYAVVAPEAKNAFVKLLGKR